MGEKEKRRETFNGISSRPSSSKGRFVQKLLINFPFLSRRFISLLAYINEIWRCGDSFRNHAGSKLGGRSVTLPGGELKEANSAQVMACFHLQKWEARTRRN